MQNKSPVKVNESMLNKFQLQLKVAKSSVVMPPRGAGHKDHARGTNHAALSKEPAPLHINNDGGRADDKEVTVDNNISSSAVAQTIENNQQGDKSVIQQPKAVLSKSEVSVITKVEGGKVKKPKLYSFSARFTQDMFDNIKAYSVARNGLPINKLMRVSLQVLYSNKDREIIDQKLIEMDSPAIRVTRKTFPISMSLEDKYLAMEIAQKYRKHAYLIVELAVKNYLASINFQAQPL